MKDHMAEEGWELLSIHSHSTLPHHFPLSEKKLLLLLFAWCLVSSQPPILMLGVQDIWKSR